MANEQDILRKLIPRDVGTAEDQSEDLTEQDLDFLQDLIAEQNEQH